MDSNSSDALILRNFYKFREYAEVAPNGFVMRRWFDASGELDTDFGLTVRGDFSEEQGATLRLFQQKSLCLGIRNAIYKIRHSSHVRLSYTNGQILLRLFDADELIDQVLCHDNRAGKSMAGDPTGFIEEEDFLFPLFIANVINNAARSKLYYVPRN